MINNCSVFIWLRLVWKERVARARWLNKSDWPLIRVGLSLLRGYNSSDCLIVRLLVELHLNNGLSAGKSILPETENPTNKLVTICEMLSKLLLLFIENIKTILCTVNDIHLVFNNQEHLTFSQTDLLFVFPVYTSYSGLSRSIDIYICIFSQTIGEYDSWKSIHG